MIDALKKLTLQNGVQLHLLKSEKFKTVLFGVYLQRPLKADEAAKNAVIARVIEKCNAQYPTLKQMNHKLESLYGSLLVSDVHKYGEKQMIQVKMQMPSDVFIEDETLMDEGVRFLSAAINDPLVEDGGLSPHYVDAEKKGLINEYKTRIEDKQTWALGRCIETMCADEPYAIHEIGSEESLEAVEPKSLLEHYKKLLEEAPMDIIVIGNYDIDAMAERFKTHFKVAGTDRTYPPREQVVFPKKPVAFYEEKHPLKQGRLVMGYRMNIPYEDALYVPALVANIVLGSGGSSKLFRDVREKEGLCYSVFARPDKFKSIMLIYAGVDVSQFDKAQAMIEAKVEELKNGDVTEAELAIAKQSLFSSLQSMSDFPNSYINFYYGQYLTGGTVDLDAYGARLERITVADITEAAKHFNLEQVVRLNKTEA